MTALLDIRDLEVRYGKLLALQRVTVTLEPGAALAVLGRNGAGKSTLLKAIAGLVHPSGGAIRWKGTPLDGVPADHRARRGISLVPEGRRVFPNLTVRENLRLGGFQLRADELTVAVERVTDLFPILAERAEQPAGQLSGGQQQMLSIGRALIAGPELLLLDEPSLGLAPRIAAALYARLRQLRETGITLIVVEQRVERVLRLVDEVMALRLGEVTVADAAERLDRDDPRLRDAYLGQGTT